MRCTIKGRMSVKEKKWPMEISSKLERAGREGFGSFATNFFWLLLDAFKCL